MKYTDLVSRHKEYIPKKLQSKVKECRVLLVGCGLGSQIALLATRVGFQDFILIDGDIIDGHNLNRQGFGNEHLGENKALVVSRIIRSVNPRAKIEVHQRFLKDRNLARKLIDKSDIIINMADPSSIMYFINDYAQSKGKPVFFPLNIIWGGFVLVFTKKSSKLVDVVGKRRIFGSQFYFTLLEKTFSTFSPHTLRLYEKMGRKLIKHPYLPQLGTAAYLTSSIVVSGMVKWLSREKLRVAPKPIFLDLWEEMS